MLKLGVVLDARIQERWILDALNQALSVPRTRLAAIAIASGSSRRSLASGLHRWLDGVDRQLRCRNEKLFAPVDVAAELKVVPLEIGAVREGDGWRPDGTGIDALRRCNVDVWLCFAATPPLRPLPAVSRLGVWGIEIGQDVAATNLWAGAMEVSIGNPVTMLSVVDYAEAGNDPLYRSYGATLRNSVRRNRLNSLRKGVSLFKRLLDRLARSGDTRLRAPAADAPPPACYPALREPTLRALTRLSSRLVTRVAANQWRALRWRDQWQIAYYFKDEAEPPGCRFERLRYIVPPRDRFWADPFAVEHQGRHFIFFEELHYRTQKGCIMAVEVFDHAEPGAAQLVLERPYHLSYPFVFAWDGELYMLPETAGNGTVELYRCEEFPLRWGLQRVLLENVSAFDATLWQQDGRWWMFVNLAEPGADSSDELHLYASRTPLGPWTPHRANPVISDVRRARSAGPLFTWGGRLYRPSQDCSLAYGHSVLINRVDVLDHDDYRETTVHRLAPGWRRDILRVHTLGGSRRLRVVDYLVSRKRNATAGGHPGRSRGRG